MSAREWFSLTEDTGCRRDAGALQIVAKQAPAAAGEFARFVLGGEGRAILARYGFGGGNPAE